MCFVGGGGITMHALINGIPRSTTPRLDWEIVHGDLTEYSVKNPSLGALPDVNRPIHGHESIGGGNPVNYWSIPHYSIGIGGGVVGDVISGA